MLKIMAVLLALSAVLLTSAHAGPRVCPGGCDYDRIQTAVDAAASGDVIMVESGTYQHDLLVNKPLLLHGLDTGQGRPLLQGNVTVSGAVLRGFRFALRPGSTLLVNSSARIYQNEFSIGSKIILQGSASWNSSEPLSYQLGSNVHFGPMGNYWPDYGGKDNNRDGIGDQPKVIDGENVDYHPLMQPLQNYKISDEEEEGADLIRTRPNQPFIISLPANPKTAYQWFVNYDYYLLRLDDERFEKGSSSALGSGGTAIFVFSPLRPGKTTISLVYRRSWDNIVADARVFLVDIAA